MSYLLPHLRNGWAVDQAILSEEDRVVVIRFGSDADDTCMRMDEVRRNAECIRFVCFFRLYSTTTDTGFVFRRDADPRRGGG